MKILFDAGRSEAIAGTDVFDHRSPRHGDSLKRRGCCRKAGLLAGKALKRLELSATRISPPSTGWQRGAFEPRRTSRGHRIQAGASPACRLFQYSAAVRHFGKIAFDWRKLRRRMFSKLEIRRGRAPPPLKCLRTAPAGKNLLRLSRFAGSAFKRLRNFKSNRVRAALGMRNSAAGSEPGRLLPKIAARVAGEAGPPGCVRRLANGSFSSIDGNFAPRALTRRIFDSRHPTTKIPPPRRIMPVVPRLRRFANRHAFGMRTRRMPRPADLAGLAPGGIELPPRCQSGFGFAQRKEKKMPLDATRFFRSEI